MQTNFFNGKRIAVFAVTVACSGYLLLQMPASAAKKEWVNSPLTTDQQSALKRAGSSMKSGKFERARGSIQTILESATDVPKCLAIAQYTESYAYPMMESRRACLNKALELCNSREDLVLVAIKSRQYQFFEITRQAIYRLLENAKTVPDLYDVARKCQEVALNDVAHQAMEKAYTGIKDDQAALSYAEQCKIMGMDDLLRKVCKDLIDDEDNVGALCDLVLKFESYQMRDQTRYGLRKALDKAATVADMEDIFEAAKRMNENDIANRASYFVRKGKIIQKIKEDRANYEAQMRAWREGISLDQARQKDNSAVPEAGFSGGSSGTRKLGRPEAPQSGF